MYQQISLVLIKKNVKIKKTKQKNRIIKPLTSK